ALRERQLAVTLAERSISGPEVAAAWARCRTEVAASPVHAGLDLAPQPGLVPLGKNAVSERWEFWHVPTGARPNRPHDAWVTDPETGVVMTLVPPSGGDAAFFVAASPLTRAQFLRIRGHVDQTK